MTIAAPRVTAVELSVAFVRSDVSRRINRERRNRDKTADVLSFSLGRGPRERELVGEVLLCPAQIRRRAKTTGRRLSDETALLFVHGLLHVLGYDHVRNDDTRRMERLERKILGNDKV